MFQDDDLWTRLRRCAHSRAEAWVLQNFHTLPTLEEVTWTPKKHPKRTRDGSDLDKTIAELFRAIDELKSGRPVSHATLIRAKELAETWHPELGKSNVLVVLL